MRTQKEGQVTTISETPSCTQMNMHPVFHPMKTGEQEKEMFSVDGRQEICLG
jgi:hypothetical protein